MKPTRIVPRYESTPGRKGTVTRAAPSPTSASPEVILRQLQRHRSPRVARPSVSPSASSSCSRSTRPSPPPSISSGSSHSSSSPHPPPAPSASPRPVSAPRVASSDRCPTAWCGGGAAAHECELRINVAADEAVFAFFASVPGLGLRSANRVLAVRESEGPFVSASDFDRRVPRLTFARLNELAAAAGHAVSLMREVRVKPPPPPPGATPSEAGSGLACSIATTFVPDPDAPMADLCANPVRLASWNAGHFSMKSRCVTEKTAHLVRFVQDCGDVAVIALQEVFGDVPGFIARKFAEKLHGRWMTVSPELEVETGRSSFQNTIMQAFVYDAKRLDGRNVTREIPAVLLEPFLRTPVVGLFSFRQPRASGGQYFALINVHLSTRYKESEIPCLPALIAYVQDFVETLGGERDMCLCVGDFNISADAGCFQEMRDAGLVELVRPPNSCADPNEAKRYLTTPTTVGNNWLDNFWMSLRCRAAMEDAWCFDFGGRCLGISDANGYEYAGQRRAQRSDHYAVVTQFKF